jgi:homoserine kinase
VSNVACGFDVLGFAIESELGDRVCARRSSCEGVRITLVTGDLQALPRDAHRNTAGVAATSVLERARQLYGVAPPGVELEIHKHMPISSGIGSSAASAAAAAAAVNALLDRPLSRAEVLACALDGESVASGSRHADNVAPALFGGLVAVRSLDPEPDILDLPIPRWLSCALVLPELEVSTQAAREALGDHVRLADSVQQSANLAALVHALHTADSALLARSLVDCIAEPCRKAAVPGFDAALDAARSAGALGGSLSGSGPAIFALCREAPGDESTSVAREVAQEMARALDRAGVESRSLAVRIAPRGALQSVSEASDRPGHSEPADALGAAR